MKTYLKIIAVLYGIGAVLHLLDVFDLRLSFSEMSTAWRAWILYLLIFDSLAAFFLWQGKKAGEYLFLLVAASQLIAYVFFSSFFGSQTFLIVFHVITVVVYGVLKFDRRKASF